jgi:hypothetical protein
MLKLISGEKSINYLNMFQNNQNLMHGGSKQFLIEYHGANFKFFEHTEGNTVWINLFQNDDEEKSHSV